MTEACHVSKHQRGRPAGTTGSSVFDISLRFLWCCHDRTSSTDLVSLHRDSTLFEEHRPVTPWTVPPRKQSPWTAHGRIIGPPRPNIAAIPGPPPTANGPPSCRLRPFHNCLCHSACIWRTAWTLPVRSKQGKATFAEVSAGGGDDTTPIEEESA